MSQLIGFYSAKPLAGKTTAATVLMELGFIRVPFAGTLKSMFRVLLRDLGLNDVEIAEILTDGKEVPTALLNGKTPREALQTLGTEWGRQRIDPDLWIRCWAERTRRILDEGGNVVVDDVRFLSEAALLRGFGGKLVKVIRPYGCSDAYTDHASEGGLEGELFDAIMINDRSLQEFQGAASVIETNLLLNER